MKEWTFDEAIATIAKSIFASDLAKECAFTEHDADQLAREIATALEEAE